MYSVAALLFVGVLLVALALIASTVALMAEHAPPPA